MPPRSFMLFAFSLVAALHAYIGWRILPGLAGPSWLLVVGIIALIISAFLVPAGLLARGIKRQPLADRVAWTGLLAMGLFSSLFVLTLARDILLLGAALIGVGNGALSAWSARAVPVLALVVTLIGFVNARRVAQVVRVDVPIDDLPPALHGFSIAQISDIHVGPTIKRGYLAAIVGRVNALQPDLIAVTGDLVDGSVAQLREHTAPLADLVARHGTYFVTGNHEYYSNAPAWIAEVQRLGLTVLSNQHVVLDHHDVNGRTADRAQLLVAGVTDFTAHHFDATERSDPAKSIAGAPPGVAVRMLLAHQPRSAEAAAAAGFDLQLSGHTHGGQFFPWNLFVPLQQPYTSGLNRLRQMWVYTSRGTGYWGPPKRFGAPSEITYLRLVPAS